MPILYDIEFIIENEYSLGLPLCEEDNTYMFGNINTSEQVLTDNTNGKI